MEIQLLVYGIDSTDPCSSTMALSLRRAVILCSIALFKVLPRLADDQHVAMKHLDSGQRVNKELSSAAPRDMPLIHILPRSDV